MNSCGKRFDIEAKVFRIRYVEATHLLHETRYFMRRRCTKAFINAWMFNYVYADIASSKIIFNGTVPFKTTCRRNLVMSKRFAEEIAYVDLQKLSL